jgi:hypothetical protein
MFKTLTLPASETDMMEVFIDHADPLNFRTTLAGAQLMSI